MFSSFPGLCSSLSSQSSAEDMVSRSSTVIADFVSPSWANGFRSARNANAGADADGILPSPTAMPAASEVTDFVAERVSCSVPASVPPK